MTGIITTTFIIFTTYSIGMFAGAILSDYEWLKMIETNQIKCYPLDPTEVCIRKAKIQHELNIQNKSKVTSDQG